MFYLSAFILTLAAAAALTGLIRGFARRYGIVDRSDAGEKNSRKLHVGAMPLLGGVAVFISFFGFLFLNYEHFLAGDLEWRHLIGFAAGGLLIMIGGFLDDRFNLSAKQQIIFPLLASLAVVSGGVEVARLTNPLGGYFDLSASFIWSPLIIVLWLLGMMYTTKLLDGVDGLVGSVSVIGGFIIFLFTLTTRYYQPDIALAALLFCAAAAGFLLFNWHPAKIFLGEGGSLFMGYVLGVLSIISGGKIAIALLIIGIPILDVIWTIVRRLIQGRNPFKFADRRHLHHRLLALGLSQRQTVSVFCFFALSFGLSGLVLQSAGKFFALVSLVVLMLALVVFLRWLDQRRRLN